MTKPNPDPSGGTFCPTWGLSPSPQLIHFSFIPPFFNLGSLFFTNCPSLCSFCGKPCHDCLKKSRLINRRNLIALDHDDLFLIAKKSSNKELDARLCRMSATFLANPDAFTCSHDNQPINTWAGKTPSMNGGHGAPSKNVGSVLLYHYALRCQRRI